MDLGDPFTPSSSPPSSPSFGPTDSSPASSPDLSPIIFGSPALSHPFAASSKSNRRPPLYEKKFATSPTTDLSGFISKPSVSRVFKCLLEEDGYAIEASSKLLIALPENREATIWDEAISNAIDNGRGTVELSSRRLTYIPQSIGDLVRFYVIPERAELANSTGGRLFSRTNTMPVHVSHPSRSFERTVSITESSMSREEVQLYLASNEIHSLPRELFSLTKMTVLSLRNNKLTHLPAEVSLLKNLRELNISNNQVTYLPSEMLDMRLQTLALHPNPFLPEPVIPDPVALPSQARTLHRRRSITRVLSHLGSSNDSNTRAVSCTTHTYTPSPVPSLFELCLRVLLSPCLSTNSDATTNLTELYTLPIPGEWGSKLIPPSVRDILNACVPESVSAAKTMSPNPTPRTRARVTSSSDSHSDGMVMGIGVCPNPAHGSKMVFAKHMEERFTWENVVAGVSIGTMVPMKWRGCMQGCLTFLDEKTGDNTDAVKPDIQRAEEGTSADMNAEIDVDEDTDMDDSVVQAVSVAPIGDIDFEDDA